MKRLIAVGLISSALVLVGACGNTGYGTATGKADLTSFNGNPGTPSCSNPARPANTALYCPAAGILPYPFDAYFAGSTDGTLNIQPPNQLNPLQDAVNALDGFSTTAPIRERFNGPIDAPSLAAPGAVVVIHISTNNAGPQAKAPVKPTVVGGTGDFTPLVGCAAGGACTGADYSVGVASDDPKILEITPLKPLAASTCLPTPPATTSPCQTMPNGGNGEAYLVLLTKTITVGGVAAAPDADYANFLGALNSGGPTCPSITDPTLNALCQLTGAHLGLAQLYAQVAPGFNPANVVASFSFSTLSTTDTLAAAAAEATPQQIKVNPLIAPNHTPLTTAAFRGLGLADVYVGVMTLPYYLATTAVSVTAPDTEYWQASATTAPDKTSTLTTRFNPFPVPTVKQLQVPVLMTVPNTNSGATKPAGGWPVVIFQHGVLEDRTNLFGVADSFAKAGFIAIAIDLPLHGLTKPFNPSDATTILYASSANPYYTGLGLPASGSIERTFDLDTINMAAGLPGLDPTGSHYINLKSVLTYRDNIRESSVDLVTLGESIGSIALPAPATAPYVNPSNVHFVGHSMGAIIGVGFLAVMPPQAILTATLANPGGKFVYLGIESPTFGPPTIAALEQASNGLLTPGTTPFAQYLRDGQSVIDAADPWNFIGLAALQHPIHMIEVVGTTPPPAGCNAQAPAAGCPDQVVPNDSTDRLIEAGGFTQVHPPGAGPSATPLPPSVVKFTAGTHASFLDPTAGSAPATIEMQTEAATFAATNGTYLPVTPGAPVQ
jgi:pimeloyl-ACP methyl ester carboxylesterase